MSATQSEVYQSPTPDTPSAWSRLGGVVRADLRPASGVLVVVALLGLPLGWLWSQLAPPEIVTAVVEPSSDQVGLQPMLGQSEHRFDAMAAFVLLGLAAGVLTGVALWLLRRHRGPVVLVAAVLGALAAAWLAARCGVWLAEWRYPVADVQPGDVVTRPPVLESDWVIVAQPFAAAVTYSFLVAWNGTEDLGRGPP